MFSKGMLIIRVSLSVSMCGGVCVMCESESESESVRVRVKTFPQGAKQVKTDIFPCQASPRSSY